MTAIKPIENRRVTAVAAERYALNKQCSHPECREPATDPHHAFPRSAIGGDSWFVEIIEGIPLAGQSFPPIPHVTGLCRTHHEEVERGKAGHAWIRYNVEGDGLWTWWFRNDGEDGVGENLWAELGPLNPQPGSVEGKAKRKRFQGEARRKRRVISLRVPDDAPEDGAALLDEAVSELETKIKGESEHRPMYYTLMDALAYTNLNADETDFAE